MSQRAFPHQRSLAPVDHVHDDEFAALDHAHAGYAAPGHTHPVEDTGWAAITNFQSGATAYQTSLGSAWCPRYRKINGIVYLQGLINANTTADRLTLAILPVGFRPRDTIKKAAMIQGSSTRAMYFYGNGDIYVWGPGTTSWHSIHVVFPADN